MSVVGPTTGYQVTDPNTNNVQDLGNMFVSKDYMLDIYPNLVPGRTAPALWGCGYGADGQIGYGGSANSSSFVQIGIATTWKQISAGSYVSGGIQNNGTLWMWGYGGAGNLGNNATATYSSPIQVGALTSWKQVSAGSLILAISSPDLPD
jgi:Regulator of chromosome condensation (RCC1) repeat